MISRTDYSKMSGSPGSMGCFDQYLSSMCWEELAKELSQLVNPPSCDHHCSNRPSFRQKKSHLGSIKTIVYPTSSNFWLAPRWILDQWLKVFSPTTLVRGKLRPHRTIRVILELGDGPNHRINSRKLLTIHLVSFNQLLVTLQKQ